MLALDEFFKKLDSCEIMPSTLIVRLRYKYSFETEFIEENEVLLYEGDRNGAPVFAWENDWDEGQTSDGEVYVVGWIDADDVKVPGWEEEIMNRKDAPEGAKQHTMAELKPCPFCGNSVKIDYSYYYRDYVIYCNDCDMIFSLDDCNVSEEKVCEAWNRRADNG